jgi:cysteine desulfurase
VLYLDHNASSPPRPEAIEESRRAARDFFANPSSQHAPGRKARAFLEECRERVAACLGVHATELVFTSGGTESNRLAIEGALQGRGGDASPPLALAFDLEHPSVLEPLCRLRDEGRIRLEHIRSSAGGELLPDELADLLARGPGLVTIQHANSETGVIQPLGDARAAIERSAHASSERPVLHADMAQSLGRIRCRPGELGPDLASFSAHKLGGPRGAGALWVKRGVPFTSILRGGPQERGLRAGTEDLAAIAGFARALEIASSELEDAARPTERGIDLGALLADLLARRVEGASLNGDRTRVLPNTVNVSFEGVSADLLVIELDRRGVAVSTGSACASGSREPSRILRAMHLPESRVRSAIRLSTGSTTTRKDVEEAVEIVRSAVETLRAAERALSRSPGERID